MIVNLCVIALILGQTTESGMSLTAGGVIVMTASIAFVLGLVTFCVWRILREEHPEQHHHAPLDIDTNDVNP